MYTEKLSAVTYSLHHNPNCPSPFQIRLVGHKSGRIDNLPINQSQDIIGHGQTMEEAAQDAWQQKFPT